MRSMIGALCYSLWRTEARIQLNPSVRFGDKVSFYHDVPQILHNLRSENVVIAVCSRTSATAL
jgi:hypothetical protein